MMWDIPEQATPYLAIFYKAEYQYQLPPGLIVRVAQQESDFNPQAKSDAGAEGIMQIVPKWHPGCKDPFDPEKAIPYAAQYLRNLYTEFKTWPLALAAYNWGPGNLAHSGIGHAPRETRDYVWEILTDLGMWP